MRQVQSGFRPPSGPCGAGENSLGVRWVQEKEERGFTVTIPFGWVKVLVPEGGSCPWTKWEGGPALTQPPDTFLTFLHFSL